MSKAIGYGIIGGIGLVALIVSLVFLGLFSGLIKKKIKEELPLKQSDVWKRWAKPPVPIYIKFWVFNVDNPDEVLYEHKKPNLIVKGPYIYEEIRYKVDIVNSDDGKSITYKEYKEFRFLPNMTNKNRKDEDKLFEDDRVTVINVPMLGMANVGLEQNKMFDGIFNMIAGILNTNDTNTYDSGLFTTQKVGELFVTGYTYKGLNKLIETIPFIKQLGYTDQFGVFYDEHKKTGKTWTIDNGVENDMKNYLEVIKYGDVNGLSSWRPNSTCNQLRGTDGTAYPPDQKKENRLYAFNNEICRTVYFEYWKEESLHDIDLWRFRIPQHFFANPVDNSTGNLTGENECYCMYDGDKRHRCNRAGVMDITTCPEVSKGAHVIMSEPHFHYGDEALREPFNGLNDTKDDDDKYGTIIDVEPMTGAVLRAYKRIQVNAGIFNISGIRALDDDLPPNLNEKIFPLLYIEEGFEATEENAKTWKDEVGNKVKVGMGVIIGIIVVGALLVIISIGLFICHRRRQR